MSDPERIWGELERFVAFSGGHVETGVAWCPPTRPFVQWCTKLATEAAKEPTIAKVKHCKVLLTDRYFHFRASVGRQHRDVTNAHPCLYQAFVETWESLNELELALAPLELLPVPAQQQALLRARPRQEVAGILIGEEP